MYGDCNTVSQFEFFLAHCLNRAKDLQNEKIRNGNVEVEDKLAMMEVLSLCDTNGDDRLSLAEAKICEVCLGLTNIKNLTQ